MKKRVFSLILALISPLAFTTPLAAAEPGALVAVSTVAVVGEAKQVVPADQAVISISVVSEDKKLAAAKADNDKRLERLVTLAREHNIPLEKINPSNVNISPQYDYDQNTRKQIFKGYSVYRSLNVTVDKVENVEKILSAIVDANLDRVDNVQYGLAEPTKAGNKLRAQAFADAKERATVLADAAGVKLGKAISISTAGAEHQPIRPMMAKAMSSDAESSSSVAPSLPGQITQQERLNVVFTLE
jgi:uncharacterized protein